MKAQIAPGSAAPISRISVRRKRYRHVVMTIILYLEHHVDKWIESVLCLRLEIRGNVICKFIHATVVCTCPFLKKILNASVPVGNSFLHDAPVIFT